MVEKPVRLNFIETQRIAAKLSKARKERERIETKKKVAQKNQLYPKAKSEAGL